MADVAEIVKEAEATEKVVEKKPIDVEEEEEKNSDESNDAEKPKENGSAENGEKKNGQNGDVTEVAASKRKSGAGDATDAPTEGATPEKKAKISKEDKETEAESTNGEAEVVA